jgi:hypothetical protein
VFSNPRGNTGDFIGGTAASGIIGGLASVAGGGKFENGAVTGAFGYMFNAAAGRLFGGYVGAAIAGTLGIESGDARPAAAPLSPAASLQEIRSIGDLVLTLGAPPIPLMKQFCRPVCASPQHIPKTRKEARRGSLDRMPYP